MAVSLLSNNGFSYYDAIERSQWKPLEVENALPPWHEPYEAIATDSTVRAPWFWEEDDAESRPVHQSRSTDSISAATPSSVHASQAEVQTQSNSAGEYKLSDHENRAIMKMSADRVRQIVPAPCVAYRGPTQSLDTLKSFSACAVLLALAVLVSQPKLPDFSFIKSKFAGIVHVQSVKSMQPPAVKSSTKVAPVVAICPRAARSIFFRPAQVRPAQAQVTTQALPKATPVHNQPLTEYTGPSSMAGLALPHRHAYQTATVSE